MGGSSAWDWGRLGVPLSDHEQVLLSREADVIGGVCGAGKGHGAADAGDGVEVCFSPGSDGGGRLELSAWGELASGDAAADSGLLLRLESWHDDDCGIISL